MTVPSTVAADIAQLQEAIDHYTKLINDARMAGLPKLTKKLIDERAACAAQLKKLQDQQGE